ncbi:hypothetical protein J6590_010044 [Homalodisca vitripennis]|nr:hypothetical protein J6590_010044 [Homalodisca vitripennis]
MYEGVTFSSTQSSSCPKIVIKLHILSLSLSPGWGDKESVNLSSTPSSPCPKVVIKLHILSLSLSPEASEWLGRSPESWIVPLRPAMRGCPIADRARVLAGVATRCGPRYDPAAPPNRFSDLYLAVNSSDTPAPPFCFSIRLEFH